MKVEPIKQIAGGYLVILRDFPVSRSNELIPFITLKEAITVERRAPALLTLPVTEDIYCTFTEGHEAYLFAGYWSI